MTSSAVDRGRSPLEAVLLDVHATLADLLVAADDQYAAVVADNRKSLETITRLQERLATRLERAERKRLEILAGRSLAAAVADLPADEAEPAQALSQAIARQIRELQPLHARNASLLERSAELAGETATFLQRLVSPLSSSYGVHGRRPPQHSVLVDRRA